ncbi:hypothetical protein B0H10DRAFT_670292 [Mycena sp. CBHHK59/15]|nr:hypothetical protein B0H10DRAFT_670292 [Mycena sp. CBHHK59/15]
MSTEPLHKFLVYAPDKAEEGTYDRRLAVRDAHLESAKRWMEEKFLLVGGAMLTPESLITPASKKMIGSTFVCQGRDINEVRKKVEGDVYYKNGVWDPERIVIVPYVTITPFP